MTPEETVNEFIRRIVAADLDGACELASTDLEYDNVPVGKSHGHDGLKAILGGLLTGVAGVDWVIHRQVASGNVVMNERTDRFQVGETWMDLPVAGIFEVGDDGKIVLWRDYFDMATFTNEMARVTAA
jgi:limonene-1,2-epoxide hydrolase